MAIVGPKSDCCEECGQSGVQFLVGQGAFCLGCGSLRMEITTGPWETRRIVADKSRGRDPDTLTAAAVADAMRGFGSLIDKRRKGQP